jgi:alpha-1,3/alpha-1,6-mannosyltransferase
VHLVLSIAFLGDELRQLRPDAFVVDQLSACVPLLRWICSDRHRTLFYCHFPDQLLADRKELGIRGLLKSIYRIPFDWFEGWSTAASDKIVVNSKFTQSVASKIIPAKGPLTVIYPCVGSSPPALEVAGNLLWDGQFKLILSINRFERKKDIGLAIKAFQGLSAEERQGKRLVLAGGYDSRVAENVDYHQELVEMAETMGLKTATAKTVTTALSMPDEVHVLFMLSVPGAFKTTLLQQSAVLVYTPVNEHFGIVPVEAMQSGLPVLASDTGGPLETVIDGETGWLRDASKPEQWTDVLRLVLRSDAQSLQRMAEAGKKRVKDNFTRLTMAKKFEGDIKDMISAPRSDFIEGTQILMAMAVVAAFAAALLATIINASAGRPADKRTTEFAKAKRILTGKEADHDFFAGGRMA